MESILVKTDSIREIINFWQNHIFITLYCYISSLTKSLKLIIICSLKFFLDIFSDAIIVIKAPQYSCLKNIGIMNTCIAILQYLNTIDVPSCTYETKTKNPNLNTKNNSTLFMREVIPRRWLREIHVWWSRQNTNAPKKE